MPEKLINRIDIALEKLNVHPFERNIIKPFVVIGFDTFTAGKMSYIFLLFDSNRNHIYNKVL